VSLPRPEVVSGTAAELAGFEELIRSIDEAGWRSPSRCEGWSVADVCAHVVGTIADIASGRLAELTAPDSPARQVAERAGRTQHELADELQAAAKVTGDIGATFDDAAWAGPPPVDIPGTLGTAVEGIWYDAYVHTDDVRAALGRPSPRGPGLRAAVSHLADLLSQRDWGPATLALDGLEQFPVSGGGRQRVTGDPLSFVLAATGRADPAVLGLDPTVNVYA